MNNKERIKNFMRDYEELCIKHGMSLSHEDCQGAFIIDEYDKDNVEWVKSALDGFEIRDRKNKDIEINIVLTCKSIKRCHLKYSKTISRMPTQNIPPIL